jgi:DNA-binding transcriptional LysR family regulator
VAGELGRGELVALETDLPLTRTFSLVWHPERYRSPLWQAFKVFLQEDDQTLAKQKATQSTANQVRSL